MNVFVFILKQNTIRICPKEVAWQTHENVVFDLDLR